MYFIKSNITFKKRKAQNRAAQRAFRERKEKHLKDLETKVQDLEKASETANHENSILRAQIEKMSVELREYRKRLSIGANGRSPPLSGGLPAYLSGRSSNNNTVNNPNDVNFQFEFPKFGRLPGLPVLNATRLANSNSTTSPASVHRASSSSNNGSISPFDQSFQHKPSFTSATPNNINSNNQDNQLFGQLDSNDLSEFFTPSAFDNVTSEFSLEQPAHNPSRSSTDSSRGLQSTGQSTGQSTSYSSPSASSNNGSNAGLSSSCGTSPEPYTQSPAGFKNDNMLSTIGEEKTGTNSVEGEVSFCEKLAMACGNSNNPVPRTMSESGVKSGNFQTSGFDLKTPSFDLNGIDWFAQQNGNQFDPQLFGDYREPQNNILSGGLYDDTFFAEAFALPEFNSGSPFNITASPTAPKKDLVQEIDQKLSQEEEVVPGEDRAQMLTCNTMW
jgi:AP-1-like transcription factor